MKTAQNFAGIHAAVVTCFDEHNRFNPTEQCKLIDYCYEQQDCDGIAVCASTGEGLLLSEAEYWDVAQTCLAHSRKNYPNKVVILSTTHFDPMITLEKNKRALAMGFDAVLVTYPPYSKPDQHGIKAYFEFLAEALPSLPIILYNIYYRTGGKGMEPQTIIDLAKIKNIVGLKDCGVTKEAMDAVISGTKTNDFVYLCGEDDLYLEALSHGAHGAIAVMAHFFGKEMQAIKQHLAHKETEQALSIFEDTRPLIKLLFMEPNPAATKAALSLRNLQAGSPRLPLLPASLALLEKLKPWSSSQVAE